MSLDIMTYNYMFITLTLMLTDFRNLFTVGLKSKFATKLALYFSPHPQRVATLPCDDLFNITSLFLLYRRQKN